MAKQDDNPDSLAMKLFVVTMLGTLAYITVVFAFILAGNRREQAQLQPSDHERAIAPVHGAHTHD